MKKNKVVIDKLQQSFWKKGSIFRNYRHPIVKFFVLQRIRYIEKLIPISNISSVLDIGCGNGAASYYFSKLIPFTVAGDYAIDWQGFPPRDSFNTLYFNAYQLPFKSKLFDLVYMWEVLHHLADIEKAVKEAVRVSKKYVLIMEPNPINPIQYLYSYFEKNHFLIRQCNRKNIISALQKEGCKEIICKSGGLIFPNVVPPILFNLLKRISYEIPFIGITNIYIGYL